MSNQIKIRVVYEPWLEEPYALEYFYVGRSCEPFWSEVRRFSERQQAVTAGKLMAAGGIVIWTGEGPDEPGAERHQL